MDKQLYTRCYAATIICGLLNNNGYCVVTAAAQDLAKNVFDADNLMPLFNFTLVAAAFLSTGLNATIFARFEHFTRIQGLLGIVTCGYLVLAASTLVHSKSGFVIALVGSILVGTTQAAGEVINLAFLKGFPPELLGAWGAGTGLSGLAGPGFLIIMRSLGVPTSIIFLCQIPTVIVYFVLAKYLHTVRKTLHGEEEEPKDKQPLEAPLLLATDEQVRDENSPLEKGLMKREDVMTVFHSAGFIVFHLVAVYALEYSIYPGFVDRDTVELRDSDSFIQKNTYTLAWMAYNIGVTLSRVSVSFFRVSRLYLVTLLQFCNCLGWSLEAYYHFLPSCMGNAGYYLMLVWIIFVGLMGGTAYSNCNHQMNTSPAIPDNLRELGINIMFALIN
eukprot:gene3311-4167_t